MIILTGGAGFIGSNILRELNARGRTNILIVDSMKNSAKYRNLVGLKYRDLISRFEFYDRLEMGEWDDVPVEAILHQGACTDTMEYDGERMMNDNYHSCKALLEFALAREIKFIYASSAAVYGHASEAVEEPANENPLNIYGYSKLAFDNYVRQVASDAPGGVVGLRYFNVYGQGEEHKGRMASMVIQFARQIMETGVAKLFGEIGSFGPGEQTRDFVYVNDLVKINLHFLESAPQCGIVNAGSGVRSSWNQMALAVIDALGKGRIDYIPFPESLKDKYQFDTRADLTKLRQMGYSEAPTSLQDGVKDYLGNLDKFESRFKPSF